MVDEPEQPEREYGNWSDSYFGASIPEQGVDGDDAPLPVQTTRYGAGLDITALIEPAPGAVDPLASAIAEAAELVHQVQQKLDAHLSGQLDQVQGIVNDCHANICGCYDLVMDDCERVVAKCQKKIDDFLVLKLATVYNLLARFGVTYVSDYELQQRAGITPTEPPPLSTAAVTPAAPIEVPISPRVPQLPAPILQAGPAAPLPVEVITEVNPLLLCCQALTAQVSTDFPEQDNDTGPEGDAVFVPFADDMLTGDA